MIDIENLTEVGCIIKNKFCISTVEKTISITGHKLNDTTYIVTKEGVGSDIVIPYQCPEADIREAVAYLRVICINNSS